jgi:HK97 family phage major capsid protein
MAKIHELIQDKATLTASMRALMNKNDSKELGAEDKAAMVKMDADLDALDARIAAEEKQLERERSLGEKPAGANDKTDPKKAERKSAFAAHLAHGSAQTMQIYAALQQDNPTQAGYLVAPEEFRSDLIRDIDSLTFLRQKATVLPPIKNAQSLGFPTRTAGMGAWAWGVEISEPTDDSTLAYGKREFKPNPGVSGIKVSKTLLRNMPRVDDYVRAEIAAEAHKNLETAYMTGSGAGQPLGLFIASNDGIPTSRDVSTGNTATEIKFDNLIEVQEKVAPEYQVGCEWIFHSDAVKMLRKLKDSNGQYVWQASVQAGQPDLLLGRPVNRSAYAPNTFTTGLYVGLYGNLKHYWIVDALALEIQVLMELYARSNQAYYLSRLETDGAPVLSAAFARVKLG